MFYWMERARANSSISLDLIILSRAAAIHVRFQAQTIDFIYFGAVLIHLQHSSRLASSCNSNEWNVTFLSPNFTLCFTIFRLFPTRQRIKAAEIIKLCLRILLVTVEWKFHSPWSNQPTTQRRRASSATKTTREKLEHFFFLSLPLRRI